LKLHLPALYYNLGHVLHQQDDLAGAVAAYQQAIRFDAAFAQAHHSLAVVLTEQGLHEAAIHHYRQVIALQPQAVKAYNNLGCILVQQGKLDEARQVYRRAIALQPDWAVLHSNLGKALEPEDAVAAVDAYRRAISLQPDLITARYNLGRILQQQGQHAAAITTFEQILTIDSADAEAHTGCGLSYMVLGNWPQAWRHFQDALLPQRQYITAFCEWANQRSDDDELGLAQRACSRFLQALLQTETANHHRKLSRRSKPVSGSNFNSNFNLCQYLSQTCLHLGNVLMRYGGDNQYQQAETYYQQAIQLQPQRLEPYLKLIDCLAQQKRWNAALMVSHLALRFCPDAATYQRLGQLLEQQQRWQEAIFYYRQALQNGDHQRDHQRSHQNHHQRESIALAQPQESNFRLNTVNDSLSLRFDSPDSQPTGVDRIQGIYQSTLDWIIHNHFSCYVGLKPNADNQLIRHSVNSETLAFVNPLPCNKENDTKKHSSCDGLNCQRCLDKIDARFAPIHLGQHVYTCQAKTFKAEPPPYFVTEIMQGHAWITPYVNSWMVANAIAVFTPDRYLLADVSREYPGQLPDCSHPCSNFDRVLQLKSFSDAEQISGRVAVLAGLSGHNYFHWMVDILPRLELLQRSGVNLASIDWFWINDPQAHFQQETLRILGIPPEKVLASDRHPHIQAQLMVPAFPGHLGWLEPWALKFLRQTFLPAATTPCHERIYISRSNAHHRRLLNEAAVLDCLEPLGFVAVHLESLSLAEQIALFAHAKVIIAPHGGGLTNTIFCTPGACVIELVAPRYIRHYYWVISQQLGLRHFFIKGAAFACSPIQQLMYPSPLMEDIWLDIDALHAALQQLDLK
jgi:capsular polysaccharide biosynthesis protein/tetratricopeptide (TPR) repeat protein